MSDLLSKLSSAALLATQGEWKARYEPPGSHGGGDDWHIDTSVGCLACLNTGEPDAIHIALACPENVMKLVAVVKAAKAAAARLDRLEQRTIIGQTMREHGIVHPEDDVLRKALAALEDA